jgi:hypothetical protein
LSDYLALGALETDYFILMIQIERAGTSKLKTYYREKLEALKKESLQVAKRIQQDRKMSDLERSIFYSSWLYTAIRLFSSVGEGQTVDTVVERFDIPRPRAVEVLRFLSETGLCMEEGGVYRIGAQRTHVEKGSPFLLKHHSNWRIRAIEHSEGLSDEELLFTAPFSVARKDFAKFREQLLEVIKSISDQVKNSPAEEVACLNIDMFWVK